MQLRGFAWDENRLAVPALQKVFDERHGRAAKQRKRRDDFRVLTGFCEVKDRSFFEPPFGLHRRHPGVRFTTFDDIANDFARRSPRKKK